MDDVNLDPRKWHYIEIVIDRLTTQTDMDLERLANSLEVALKEGNGVAQILNDPGKDLIFSEQFSCPHCQISLDEIEPRTFSFNSPHGACKTCSGLGFRLELDPALVIPDNTLSLSEGAITPWAHSVSYTHLTLPTNREV